MMKRGRTMRIVLNGVLLLAIVALGVTVYQAGTGKEEGTQQAQLEELNQEELISQADREAEEEISETEIPEEAEPETQMESQAAEGTQEGQETPAEEIAAQETEETAQNTGAEEMAEMEAEAQAQAASAEAAAGFTEESLMEWPLKGELALDYNMENTVYFPTLDQYRLNSAIAVKSDVGAPVMAAAGGTVASVTETAKTGLTMTVDMGNGYEAVYGQLKDVTAAEGDVITQGAVLGYVNEPTKYYSMEGSNLYFAMRLDGEPIDPIAYLP